MAAVTGSPDARRRLKAATASSIALGFAMASFLPAMVHFTPAVFICLVTPVSALSLARSTPRLAAATLYWSAATVAASPMFWNLPAEVLMGVAALGIVFVAALLVHYFRARWTL